MTPLLATQSDSSAPPANGTNGLNSAMKRILQHNPPESQLRAALARAGVLMVRLIGPPGAGKTELIEATLRRCSVPHRVAVVTVNPASAREAQRLEKWCGKVAHINAPVPLAATVWEAVSKLNLADFDMILIEGSSGLARPADIGQDATVAVLSVSGGDDKAAAYDPLIQSSLVVILTKTDILGLVKFDERVFREDVHMINPAADVIGVSAVSGAGIFEWLRWLENARNAKRDAAPHAIEPDAGDNFIG